MNVPNGNGSASAFNANAFKGFQDFFTDQGTGRSRRPIPTPAPIPRPAATRCRSAPATNSSTLAGFDIPTMRGMTDRFLQFSLGPTFVREMFGQVNAGLLGTSAVAARGADPMGGDAGTRARSPRSVPRS